MYIAQITRKKMLEISSVKKQLAHQVEAIDHQIYL